MNRVFSALENLQSLTESMLAAAQAEDWDQLARMELSRSALQESLPAQISRHLPETQQSSAAKILRRCQQLDAETREILERRRHELGILLRAPQS